MCCWQRHGHTWSVPMQASIHMHGLLVLLFQLVGAEDFALCYQPTSWHTLLHVLKSGRRFCDASACKNAGLQWHVFRSLTGQAWPPLNGHPTSRVKPGTLFPACMPRYRHWPNKRMYMCHKHAISLNYVDYSLFGVVVLVYGIGRMFLLYACDLDLPYLAMA